MAGDFLLFCLFPFKLGGGGGGKRANNDDLCSSDERANNMEPKSPRRISLTKQVDGLIRLDKFIRKTERNDDNIKQEEEERNKRMEEEEKKKNVINRLESGEEEMR